MALNKFSRRSFISVGSLSFFGSFSFADALALKAESSPVMSGQNPQDLSVILLWLAGGVSQFETWDPKPEADERFRGTFKSIATNVAGVHISEHLRLSAKMADKYVIIRSMTAKDAVHESAQAFMLSGHAPLPTLNYPSVGSIVAKELPARNELPAYILTGGAASGWEQAAFLGPKYNPFVAGNPNVENYQVRDLELPMGVDWARMDRRNSLLSMADQYFRRFDTASVIETMSTHYQAAFSLISSEKAKRAFDIASEPESVREHYGRSSMGQGCLLARRLVEAGVRFVSVRGSGWDHHVNLFDTLSQDNLPEFDRAFSALLEDLEQRGMLKTTLVIVGTEFGRTPEINVNAGRDHWPNAFSLVLAGGGIQGGRVIGQTDRNCKTVTERPIQVQELIATLYRKLGIDFTKIYPTPIGRPIRLVDEPYEPVEELLS
jgi:hypothetical protein